MTALKQDRSIKRNSVPLAFIKHGMAFANTRDIADYLECSHSYLMSKIDEYKHDDECDTIDWSGFDCLATTIVRRAKRNLRVKQCDISIKVMLHMERDSDFQNTSLGHDEHKRRIQQYIAALVEKMDELFVSEELAVAFDRQGLMNATGQWLFDRAID